MLTAVLGFLAPFLPDIIGMGKQMLDHRHEMAMLKLRHEQAKNEFTWRLEEINTRADIAEMKILRQPHKSYGVQLLDKAAESQNIVWRWAFNFVFLMFSFLDWMISSVRPGLTYWAFGLYTAVKMATLTEVYGITGSVSTTLMNEAAWTPFDQELLILMVAFWFGTRARDRALRYVRPGS